MVDPGWMFVYVNFARWSGAVALAGITDQETVPPPLVVCADPASVDDGDARAAGPAATAPVTIAASRRPVGKSRSTMRRGMWTFMGGDRFVPRALREPNPMVRVASTRISGVRVWYPADRATHGLGRSDGQQTSLPALLPDRAGPASSVGPWPETNGAACRSLRAGRHIGNRKAAGVSTGRGRRRDVEQQRGIHGVRSDSGTYGRVGEDCCGAQTWARAAGVRAGRRHCAADQRAARRRPHERRGPPERGARDGVRAGAGEGGFLTRD